MSYKVEQKQIKGLPRTKTRANNFIVAHDTANANSTIDNEVAYMSRNWQNAFVTHFVGGGGRVVQIAPTGYTSWGCGPNGNGYAYAQVELCHTSDSATFKRDYAAYCQLLADLAKEAGIPITLDKGKNTSSKGIKSHNWIRENLGGTTHTDPYSYLAKWGISKKQFEKDLKAAAKGEVKIPPKGLQWRWARKGLFIRSEARWGSKVAFKIPNYYAAEINYNVEKNGFYQIVFQGKKGWYKPSTTLYWFEKNPTVKYEVTGAVVNFRKKEKWGSKVVQTKKRGDTVLVLHVLKNGWLQVVLTNGELGCIPDSPHYVKKVA